MALTNAKGGTSCKGPALQVEEREKDPKRLQQRQKQIEYGKNTVGYTLYTQAVPKEARQRRNPKHPETPDKTLKCSKRGWDGVVRQWRRRLHAWDPPSGEEGQFQTKDPAAATRKLPAQQRRDGKNQTMYSAMPDFDLI